MLLFRLRVYVMVMVVVVVVMIRRRLGIHYADGREGQRAAERIVGSTTTASRHDANHRCWHVSFDFFFVFKSARAPEHWRHTKCTVRHALIKYRKKLTVKKKATGREASSRTTVIGEEKKNFRNKYNWSSIEKNGGKKKNENLLAAITRRNEQTYNSESAPW